MPRNLTPEQYAQKIDEAIAALRRIKDDVGKVHDRTHYSAGGDGYPSSSLGGEGGSQDISDPTPVAALRRPDPDFVRRNSVQILATVIHVAKQIEVADNLRVNVMSIATESKGRVSSVQDCLVPGCDSVITWIGDNHRRAGYCPSCYKAWTRYAASASEPSHGTFRLQRSQHIVERAERKAAVTG